MESCCKYDKASLTIIISNFCIFLIVIVDYDVFTPKNPSHKPSTPKENFIFPFFSVYFLFIKFRLM